jgi:hypothetical protein
MMSEGGKTLQVHEKDSRIAPWGGREELREIARRVQLMAPGGKRLDENQALALAQGAVAHGLDPFNGEIWYIPGAGLMAGIKGLRKAARLQVEGNFWTEFEEITDPDQRDLLMIPERALAYRCLIRDSDTLRAYSGAWKELREQGIPDSMIPELLGRKPYAMGIGYVKVGEATKMDPVQVAMKRAEADALKRRFDLPFAVPSEPNDVITVDAEWHEKEEASPESTTPRQRTESAAEQLFPSESSSTPAPKKINASTAYWGAIKAAGLDRDAGKAILDEVGGDFELARKKVEEQHIPKGQEAMPF